MTHGPEPEPESEPRSGRRPGRSLPPDPPPPAASAALAVQARDLPLDAHLHTDLSPDSDVPIDDYAAQAVERGIAEIAITDHVDFGPGMPAYRFVTFAERERIVRGAAERWGPRGVKIRFGVEISYESAYEDDIRDHLSRHPYDYAIGSVHVFSDSPYSPTAVAGWVEGRSVAEVVAPYFGEVLRGIRSGLFDTIGHLDFVKRYLMPYITPAELAAMPALYEPLLLALVETGTALEINSSGLRHPPAETYPPAPIVERFRELGGTAVTAGSDAHRSRAFTSGLDEAYRSAAAAGFSELTMRRGGGRVAVAMPERHTAEGR